LDPSLAAAHALASLSDAEDWAYWGESDARLERALERSAYAIEADPSESLAYASRSGALLYSREHEAATIAARRALELDPTEVEAHLALGTSLAYGGHPREGLETLERIQSRHPRAPRVQAALGLAQRQLGRRDAALQAFVRAVELSPEDLPALVQLIVLYEEAGQRRDAARLAERVWTLRPDFDATQLATRLPFSDPLDAERMAQGLRRAGL
jgi:tetratricopeptide (TPR) repeat protein